ncbi:hypothetical protein BIFCAT_01038 [Bifidobacterium catenulatum DSM 16992 = JCM 1194 = LMG 11043]|uniref:Uncharacterized protein n=1 Tax=Bifidobacterium catenulatum DSM 16992 = JCM 1194 = LMG 11043 TaxID=566552 RepID=B6XTY9_9BIFI|nr:hypothetical protein BIFCAT_01038 [Bifidobacterium catenulatum DSM 16992 = JCM 1194 = LMG 11043]
MFSSNIFDGAGIGTNQNGAKAGVNPRSFNDATRSARFALICADTIFPSIFTAMPATPLFTGLLLYWHLHVS